MTRVRFKKDENGTKRSIREYKTLDGKLVFVKIIEDSFFIEEVGTNQVLISGSSKNPAYTLRIAKETLKKMVPEDTFNVEVRQDKL